jgi:23S rRNA pseudouridine1911/1915/1917 synthase
MKRFQIQKEDEGLRIDRFLLGKLNVSSRTFLQKILSEIIRVNNKIVKHSYKLHEGNEIEVDEEKLQEILSSVDKSKDIKEEYMKLDVYKETDDYIVINKPKGIVVHPGKGNTEHTLVNYLKGYLKKKDEFKKELPRGGLVHRLDKCVSGLIIFGKNKDFQKYIQSQFEEHKVDKIYLAKVEETNGLKVYKSTIKKELNKLLKNNMVIDDTWFCAEGYIGRDSRNRIKMRYDILKSPNSKKAISYIKVIGDNNVLIKIETGRMHQIRATLGYLGMNIVGDTLYGKVMTKKIPENIELESILLSYIDKKGNRVTFRLY